MGRYLYAKINGQVRELSLSTVDHLIETAETALASANSAVTTANTASSQAQTAITTAQTATTAAQSATSAANAATAAANAIVDSVGDVDDLTTTAKANTVTAINEVDARADTAQATANAALPKTGGTITGNLAVNGSLEGKVTATGSTESRTLANRFADIINVKDFGAKGDGVTDDTEAIQAAVNAGAGKTTVFFPEGTYPVTSVFRNSKKCGNGKLTLNGISVSASGADAAFSSELRQTKLCTLVPVYNRATQGLAVVTHNGQKYIFISQSNYITQYVYTDDGSEVTRTAVSTSLDIGHAQGLCAFVENDEIYLYCNASAASGYYGISRIHWKGSSTSNADVENYDVVTSDTTKPINRSTFSVNRYVEKAVSPDRSLLYVRGTIAEQMAVVVYDFASVIARNPVVVDVIHADDNAFGFLGQGTACDIDNLYFLMGWRLLDKKGIFVLDSKHTTHFVDLDCIPYEYETYADMINDQSKTVVRLECEGIAVDGDSLLILVDECFSTNTPPIVAHNGENWLCVYDNTGIEPGTYGSGVYWARTTKASTLGAWNDATSYTVASITSYKFQVYRIAKTGTYPVRRACNVLYDVQSQTINKNCAYVVDAQHRHIFSTVDNSNPALKRNLLTIWSDGQYGYGTQIALYSPKSPNSIQQLNTENGLTVGANGANPSLTINSAQAGAKNIVLAYGGSAVGELNAAGANNLDINGREDAAIRLMLYAANSDTFTGHGLTVAHKPDDSTIVAIRPYYDSGIDHGYTDLGLANRRYEDLFIKNQPTVGSDERIKTDIEDISDRVLDAWGSVRWVLFRFIESVQKKGQRARHHAGMVAQEVIRAFEAHSLDACKLALVCYDSWGDEYDDIEIVDQEEIVKDGVAIQERITHTEHQRIREAGELYSLRYTECLCIEAAYQRRRADRLEARIARLEQLLLETYCE